MAKNRAQIIADARRVRAEIEQQFIDGAYWNESHPDERPIDVDPDGTLRRLADGIDAMLADDSGSGPIPPLGGWMNPIFSTPKQGRAS